MNKELEKLEYPADKLLECEKNWVFLTLMLVAGFYGAYTYSIRGGVFCNAQTANFVLLAMAIGAGSWGKAAYLVIPISAYLLGTVISEAVAGPIRKACCLRWDTILIAIEMVAVIILGLLPERAPYQIAQVTINFICSMQYNTFRQAERVPMATVFCTNHLRQTGVALVKAFKTKDKAFIRRFLRHLAMLGVFVLGGIIATILCHLLLGKAIWFTLLPLGILLGDLLYADLKTEKDKHHLIPQGH